MPTQLVKDVIREEIARFAASEGVEVQRYVRASCSSLFFPNALQKIAQSCSARLGVPCAEKTVRAERERMKQDYDNPARGPDEVKRAVERLWRAEVRGLNEVMVCLADEGLALEQRRGEVERLLDGLAVRERLGIRDGQLRTVARGELMVRIARVLADRPDATNDAVHEAILREGICVERFDIVHFRSYIADRRLTAQDYLTRGSPEPVMHKAPLAPVASPARRKKGVGRNVGFPHEWEFVGPALEAAMRLRTFTPKELQREVARLMRLTAHQVAMKPASGKSTKLQSYLYYITSWAKLNGLFDQVRPDYRLTKKGWMYVTSQPDYHRDWLHRDELLAMSNSP